MLTSDLLKYTTRKGQIYPYQLGPEADALCAESLEAFGACQGLDLAAAKERLLDAAAASSHGGGGTPIIAKGIHKLLLDKCEVEEVGDEVAERRWQWQTAATALRREHEFETVGEFHAALAQATGTPFAEISAQLFSDLPDKRHILSVPDWPAARLRDRYNLAQIQGLVLRAKALSISATFADLGQQRAFFRQLKFQRLVAESSLAGDSPLSLELTVSGPLAVLDSANSYGLRLAQFVPWVLALPDFEIEAEVTLKRSTFDLVLTPKKYRFSHSPYQLKGHVPEELSLFLTAFAELAGSGAGKAGAKTKPQGRMAQVSTEPVVLPGGELVSTDFTLTGAKGQVVHLELFHKWHKGQLAKRWEFKKRQPEFPLVIGACRSLKKKPEIAALVKKSPLDEKHVIWFSSFPSAKKVWENLASWGF